MPRVEATAARKRIPGGTAACADEGYWDALRADDPNLRRLPSGSMYAPSTSPYSVSTGGTRRSSMTTSFTRGGGERERPAPAVAAICRIVHETDDSRAARAAQSVF